MAEERLGASFSIDVSQLKAGLQQANRLIRESESEFKAAAAGMDDWSKSQDGLEAKQKQLTKTLEVQKGVLNAYKKQYEEAGYAQDDMSAGAVELRTKINNQEAAIKKTEKALEKNADAMKDLGDESEDAGNKAKESGDKAEKGGEGWAKLGNVAKAAGKALAAAAAAAAAGVVAISKASLEGYAEYEQLVGGVDTLFKDASGKLQGYAAEAYKTAGLSANDYMANVTSFSAAMINSLGGDTQKAADASNQAITDMADNANKMGTSMESIVETYQSLSRGNYQMLDNLKLGYGGTKTEMERLLADAQKLTGVEYDITKFSDVTEAIHAIQTEMGITGTTAKEASSTIQGSVASMKTAWQNLLVGLADENADFDKLLQNLIDSVQIAAKNLIPRLQIILRGVINLVKELAPELIAILPPMITELLPSFIDAIVGIFNAVVDVLPGLVESIGFTLLDALPGLVTVVMKMLTRVLDLLTQMLPKILQKIVELLPQIINSLVHAIPSLLNAAVQLLMAIVQAIPIILPQLIAALPSIIRSITGVLADSIPLLVDAAVQLFFAITKAIPVICDELMKSMPEIISAIVDGLAAGFDGIKEAGKDLIRGLWDGIKDMAGWIGEKIKGFGAGVLDGLKSFFGIHSPSKLIEKEIGMNIGEAVGTGTLKSLKSVLKDVNKFDKAVNAALVDNLKGVNADVKLSAQANAAQLGGSGSTVVVNQTNNYAQAHSRLEIYKSKQQTAAAVRLAMAGV